MYLLTAGGVCSSFFRFSSSCRRFCCLRETTSVKPSSLGLDCGSSVVVTSGWSSMITTPTGTFRDTGQSSWTERTRRGSGGRRRRLTGVVVEIELGERVLFGLLGGLLGLVFAPALVFRRPLRRSSSAWCSTF